MVETYHHIDVVYTQNNRKRKFHDAWAFYLYVTFYIGLNTIFLISFNGTTAKSTSIFESFVLRSNFIKSFLLHLLFTSLFLLVCISACRYFSKAVLITSMGLALVFNFLGIIASISKGFFNIVTLLCFIYLCYTIYRINKNMEYIARMLRISARIISDHLLFVIFFTIFAFILFSLQLIPALFADMNSSIFQNLSYLILLLYLWTASIIYYFKNVLIASIVSNDIEGNPNSLSTAFYNSAMALGSISYASLVIALISTMKQIVKNMEKKDRRNYRSNNNLGNLIVLLIAKLVFKILGDIVEFVNKITFPYLAIHGTSYHDSAVLSSEILVKSQFKPLLSIEGIGFINSLFVILYIFSGALFYYFCEDYLSLSKKDGIGFIIFFMISLFIEVIQLLSTTILAVIYKAIDMPKAVIQYDADLYDFMESTAKQNTIEENENE